MRTSGPNCSKCVVLHLRYFKYEHLAKGAISKENLPIFLNTWLDRSNSACIFSAFQQRTWSTSHLTGGAWYLDCAPSFIPPFETKLRKSREAIGESAIEMVDLECIEDENERAKAIKGRIEEDRKKSLSVVLLGTPLRGSLKVPHKPFGEGGLP